MVDGGIESPITSPRMISITLCNLLGLLLLGVVKVQAVAEWQQCTYYPQFAWFTPR